MDAKIIEGYIDRVYGYAVNKTYSEDEAKELTQEILFTAVRELPKLRDEDRFEPWLWGIASNVLKAFKRAMGKQRAMYSYGILELTDTVYEEDADTENEELYDSLRGRIAMLASMYREVIVMYYYDGLSTKEIAKRLKLPEGTVTWRLSEARKKLKKECVEMQETALRPIKMDLNIYGTGNYDGVRVPFPSAFIDDALSKSILYYCYEHQRSIEELAKLCGVPAYYVEDRVENLLKREAIAEQTKGKYRTDFVIWSDKYGIYCEENAEAALMPIMDKIAEALKNIAREANKIDFYKAEKSENELFYLYGALTFEYILRKRCKLPKPDIEPKYDGAPWVYIGYMETGAHKRTSVSRCLSANLCSRGSYMHTVYSGFAGFPFRKMMYDTYINVCEDILLTGKTEDEYSAANAISEGYIIRRENGELFVTVPAFTKEQKSEFDAIVDKYFSPIADEYSAHIAKFIEGYKALFPKHLNDYADRLCYDMYFGMYSAVANYIAKNNIVPLPEKLGVCDVLEQFK